eukprot:767863-Hanusia_phi.AAC.1
MAGLSVGNQSTNDLSPRAAGTGHFELQIWKDRIKQVTSSLVEAYIAHPKDKDNGLLPDRKQEDIDRLLTSDTTVYEIYSPTTHMCYSGRTDISFFNDRTLAPSSLFVPS